MRKAELAKVVAELVKEVRRLRERVDPGTLAVTYEQAGKLLNRSTRTVRRMAAAGLIHTVPISGVAMVPMTELRRLSTPVMRSTAAVVEKVARARSLLKTSRSSSRKSAASAEAARVRAKYSKRTPAQHPQD
jgi:multidrug resistance efflux pump